MSLAPITLTTDKSTAVIDNAHRRLRQDEDGLSITVAVLNEDNTAYNLTGKGLVFCENKQNNKIIIDNGKGDNSGKFNRNSDNDTKGIFTYVLQEDAYAASGKAWFEITNGTTVDSTKNFYFDVEKDADISISNNDYIGSLKALETAMAGAQNKITSDLTDMQAQIIKKINDAKVANDGEIIQALKNLTDQTNAALSNVNEYTQRLATLQSQWDSELQNIKNKAGTDTDSAVKAINDRYTNDFNQIKSDFANWQNSTTQNYQKQVDGILAQVQKNGTEVADVQRQVNDTIAKMQDLTQQFNKIDFTLYAHKDDLIEGYIEFPLEGSDWQHLHSHDNNAISFKKPLVDYDTTLSKQGSAADAYAVGQRANDLDTGLTQLNQEIYKTFDTKDNAQDLKNGILANSSDITILSGRIDTNQVNITQLQQQCGSLQGTVNGKADSTTVYTKAQVDQLISITNWKTADRVNADTITYTSKLFLTNPSNVPNNTWGYLITNRGIDNPNRVTQEWWSDNGDTGQAGPHYYRQITYTNQNWSPWIAQAMQTDVSNLANRITALENQKPIKANSQDDAVARSKSSNNDYYW